MDDYIKYSSTRGGDDSLSYEEVLLAGLARDGGLFMPEKWPSFTHDDLKNMKELTYSKLATKILKPFIQPFWMRMIFQIYVSLLIQHLVMK